MSIIMQPARRRRPAGRFFALALAGALALGSASVLGATTANALPPGPGVSVVPDAAAPGGYMATFVYENTDPTVTAVGIRGSFQFYKTSDIGDFATTGVNTATAYEAPLGEYLDGMFPAGSTNVVYPMTGSGGTYTIQIPLPAQQYAYYYVLTHADGTTQSIQDPANLAPGNNGSLFYVGDAAHALAGQEMTFARTDGKTGTVSYVNYTAYDGSTKQLGVYLPYGYDPAKKYPTVYLSHGGGGDEYDWMTIGSAPHIMDNLVAAGKADAAVIVTMNNTVWGWDFANIQQNMNEAIIPFVESHYAVSTNPGDRSFSGLSMGAMTSSYLLQADPGQYGAYGVFSGSDNFDFSLWDAAAMSQPYIFVSAGSLDMAYMNSSYGTSADRTTRGFEERLSANGIPHTFDVYNGTHYWEVWREGLTDFLQDLSGALKPSSVAAADTLAQAGAPVTLTAQVTPGSALRPAPSGSVTFYRGVDTTGVALGTVNVAPTGQASLSTTLTAAGQVPYVAAYSGDSVYKGSVSLIGTVDVRDGLNLGVTLTKLDKLPGYEATFRYVAPASVTEVEIYGEWTFDTPAGITELDNESVVFGEDWQPGMVLAGTNNAWKSRPMTKGADGVWTFTQPLPSGTYSYGFLWDCASPLGQGCDRHPDPANLGWANQAAALAAGANPQVMSQVFVPSNPAHPTYDNAYQAPTAIGQLISMTYPAPTPTDPALTKQLAVYLPIGYDPNRALPYPTLYLQHGGGGNETDWSTQGVAQYIVEQALAAGDVQPFVIVFPNGNGYPMGVNEGYADDLTKNVIPFIEAHYNVSKDNSARAYAGLSMGGGMGITLATEYTAAFQYYGLWSGAFPGFCYTPSPADQIAAMQKITGGVHMATGLQDWLGGALPLNRCAIERADDWAARGVPVLQNNIDGIHSWDFWRQQLLNYIDTMMFKTTRVSVEATLAQAGTPVQLVADVAAVTANAKVPTGMVTFSAAGKVLGRATLGANGKAVLATTFAAAGDVPVVATYSGDALYAGATSAAATVSVKAGLLLGVTVAPIATSPGNAATFRYLAPEGVSSVQIYGEWTFDQPSNITVLNNLGVHFGENWAAGDVVAGTNNAWLTREMTKGADGVWTYRQPLPSGTFSYQFTWDCPSASFPTASGCTKYPDLANLNWANTTPGATPQTLSQVFVPSNPAFPTYDNAYQAPTTLGTLLAVTYTSPTADDPTRARPLAVYLPLGYDPNRAVPYPVLYMCHGGGGSETDWFTQGVAQYIEENQIKDGAAQPFVIVSTNYNGFPTYEAYAQDVLTNVIPYAEAHYNVSTTPSGRAFAGLSAGGRLGMTLLYDHASTFEYYGLWSVAIGYTEPTAAQLAGMLAIQGGIHMGWGHQDWLGSPQWGVIGGSSCDPADATCTTVAQINEERVVGLTALGVSIRDDSFDGIHAWDTWRRNLVDFIDSMLFKTTSVSIAPVNAQAGTPVNLVAQVTAVTANAVAPGGTVTFHQDSASGTVLGTATVGADGKATLPVTFAKAGAVKVVAVYAGDKLYAASAGAVATVTVAAASGIRVPAGGLVVDGSSGPGLALGLLLVTAGLGVVWGRRRLVRA